MRSRTRYEYLIDELKIELGIRGGDFLSILRIINREEYEDIGDISDDKVICYLIEGIVNERVIIGDNVANLLNNLVLLNDLLIKFNLKQQSSLVRARNELKKVFINIYDLEAGRYDRRKASIQEITDDIRSNPERLFPLDIAKGDSVLKCFLQRVF
jgi:hypothetical protein